jgi:hypothetical protein
MKPVIAFDRYNGEKMLEFCSVSDAARHFNTSSSNISRVCNGSLNYIKDHVFIYSCDFEEGKNYSFKKATKKVHDDTKAKMREQNLKAIPIFKYDLEGNLIIKYSSRNYCEQCEGFKKDYLRYTINKYKIVKINSFIYSLYIPEEISEYMKFAYIKY